METAEALLLIQDMERQADDLEKVVKALRERCHKARRLLAAEISISTQNGPSEKRLQSIAGKRMQRILNGKK